MQAFEYAYPPSELGMTLVVAGEQSLILRDNENGTLETWIPFAEGLLTYNGKRYGYAGDRSATFPSKAN